MTCDTQGDCITNSGSWTEGFGISIMLSYASLVKQDHPKTISTSRSHLLGTSESRQNYNSNNKKTCHVDWGRSSVPPNGRILANMCLMPATKRNKIKSWDWESGRPGCQTPWIVCQSHVPTHLGLPYMTNLHAVSRGPAGPTRQVERIPRPQVKKTLNTRLENESQKEKPLYMHIICNQSKQTCRLLLGATGQKTEHFSMLLGDAKWTLTIFSTTVD